jgi:excisionase family DNA binding protein
VKKNYKMDQTYITPQTRELINVAVDSAVKRAFEEFKKISKSQSESRDEDFLSAEEAAKFLKIELSTLYSKVSKRDLPSYRSGKRKLLFSKKELEDYITQRKGKTNKEIEKEAETYVLTHGRARQ